MFKKLIFLAVIGLIGCGYWVVKVANQPADYQEQIEIVIPRGATSRAVAQRLVKADVISHEFLFRILGRLNGFDKKLKAGEYQFQPHMSLLEVMDKIAQGDILYRRVTVPEGLTTVQIFDVLSENPYLSGDITETAQEGELLPETYSFVRGESRDSIIRQARQAMTNALAKAWAERDVDIPLKTPRDLLILASIVEKETGIDEERGLVASVFANRLKMRMPLQTDPTVIFALTQGKKDLGRLLTRQDLRVDSPYNTYKYRGLPVGPICHPGAEALMAAAQPQKSHFLYFVANGKGGHNFAKSLKEHNRNVRTWKKKR